MARQPALNERALVNLGSEKLARLVIGEAKRNAAFRKLVAAALAATKGPAAIAAIIDKRLTMGDRTTAQDLRWKTFQTTLDIDMLRDHIFHLPDFAEFDVLDKAFAHAIAFEQKYRALAFFLDWPRLGLAAKLVVDRRAEWEGRHYEALLAAAETLEPDHPVAATILYRALLDDILNRARSPAYGDAARYLEKPRCARGAWRCYKLDRSASCLSRRAVAKARAEKWLLEPRQGAKVTRARAQRLVNAN